MARVVSINSSERKTVRKKPVGEANLILDRGLEGDAHAGDWHRQVSFLAQESIDKMVAKGLDVGPGAFAENVTTEGVDLLDWPIGTRFTVGEAEFELSQIGKVCHNKCAIYKQAGDCVMPREGIFAVVRKAAPIHVGDEIKLIAKGDGTCDRRPRILLFSIITCSDTRSLVQDSAGNALDRLVRDLGHNVGPRVLVPDDREQITAAIIEAADVVKADIVFTCGGTGLGPRDVTPEATADAIDRRADGFIYYMQQKSCEITKRAMLSRAIAGVRGRTLVINLPGSEKAVREEFALIADQMGHAAEMLAGGGH